jgi:hypothetical protein
MAALSTRDDLEADFAAGLAKLSERHRRELAKLLGDPPDIANVPDEFWRRVEREAEATAAVTMLLIFLAAADEHGFTGDAAAVAGQGYVVNRAAFFGASWAETSRSILATASDRWRMQRRRGLDEIAPGTDGATAGGGVAGIDPAEIDDVLLSIFGPDRVANAAVTETTAAEYGGGNVAAEASGKVFVRIWQHGGFRPRRHAGAAHDPCTQCTPLLGLSEAEWTLIHPDLAGPPLHPNCDCFCEFIDPETGQPVRVDTGSYGFLPPTEKSLDPLWLLRASGLKNCGTGAGGFKPGNDCAGGGGGGGGGATVDQPPKKKKHIRFTDSQIVREPVDKRDNEAIRAAMTPSERTEMDEEIEDQRSEAKDNWIDEQLSEYDPDDDIEESWWDEFGEGGPNDDEVQAERDRLIAERREELEDKWSDSDDNWDYEGEYLRGFYKEHADEPRFSGGFERFHTWGKDGDGDPVFGFETAAGSEYKIWTVPESPRAKLALGESVMELGFHDAAGSHGITGAGNAREVFRNVTDATTEYLVHTGQESLFFSAAEPSRQKLYDRLVKSVAADLPDYSAAAAMTPDGGRVYIVAQKEIFDGLLDKARQQKIHPEILTKALRMSDQQPTTLDWIELEPERNEAWFEDDAEWAEFEQPDANNP